MSHFATSFDEFTIGQRVDVVVGTVAGAVRTETGAITNIGRSYAAVEFPDGETGYCRPYEMRAAEHRREVRQLELFEVAS